MCSIETHFLSYKPDLAESKSKAERDVVVSNCWSDNLSDVVGKLHTRAPVQEGLAQTGSLFGTLLD